MDKCAPSKTSFFPNKFFLYGYWEQYFGDKFVGNWGLSNMSGAIYGRLLLESKKMNDSYPPPYQSDSDHFQTVTKFPRAVP